MFSTSLLLLLAAVSYVYSEELTQPAYMTVQPGQSLSIDCKVSYSVTGYGTAWIRQPAGKTLEWIGYIGYGGGTAYSDKLKNKFSISRDTSTNTITIRGQNLQTEDTAVYYCARWPILSGGRAFDYWGKGTTVTVTSAVQGPPKSLFPLWQCGSSSDGLVTLGCITHGLASADGLTFSWTDPSGTALTDIVQYPPVRTDGSFTSVSQARVKASDWNNSKQFKCHVKNSAGNLDMALKKPEGMTERPPSVLLTTSTQTEADNDTSTFICLAEHYSVKNGKFNWNVGKNLTNDAKPLIISKIKGVHTAVSVLEISTSTWMNSPVVCQVSHKMGTVEKVVKYAFSDSQSPKPIIIPPSTEEMLINRAGILECKADGKSGFTAMKWLIGKKELASLPGKNTSENTLLSLLTKISFDDWSTGKEFICEVQHPTFVHEYERAYFKRETGKKERPKVYLLAPPESSEDSVTLTCYVKDFYPKEVAVSWLVGDEHVESSKQNTSSVIKRDDLFSAYSKLIVKTADWKKGTVYTCRVYHESIEESVRLISRSISSNSDPPTIMNLSLNVPSACHMSKICNESSF